MLRTVHEAPGLSDSTHDGGILIESSRLAFLMLLGADVMLFTGLMGAYLVLRGGSLTWPPPEAPKLEDWYPHVSLLFIALASVALWIATRSARDAKATLTKISAYVSIFFLILSGTIIGIALQHLIAAGMDIHTVFGGIYLILIGTYLLHVIGAVGFISSRIEKMAKSPAASHQSFLNLAYFVSTLTLLWFAVSGAVYR